MMVTATLKKKLGPPFPKENDDACFQEEQEPYATCTFLSQIDVKNKQLFSPLS